MILVTVGTQLPFDRLVRAVESWAISTGHQDVIFQVGSAGYHPTVGRATEFISPPELQSLIERAELVIGHAGIGSIISCLSLGKPIVIMPREFRLGEHRNDHQMATVARLHGVAGLFVAGNDISLDEAIESARHAAFENTDICFSEYADKSLVSHIRKLLV